MQGNVWNVMEMQGIQNIQDNLENGKQSKGTNSPIFQNLLQCCSNQESVSLP